MQGEYNWKERILIFNIWVAIQCWRSENVNDTCTPDGIAPIELRTCAQSLGPTSTAWNLASSSPSSSSELFALANSFVFSINDYGRRTMTRMISDIRNRDYRESWWTIDAPTSGVLEFRTVASITRCLDQQCRRCKEGEGSRAIYVDICWYSTHPATFFYLFFIVYMIHKLMRINRNKIVILSIKLATLHGLVASSQRKRVDCDIKK